MDKQKISETILGCFKEKNVMQDLSLDDDFFDLGISSLTVVELQIIVEKALGAEVSTSKLMAVSTVNKWADLYSEALKETALEQCEA